MALSLITDRGRPAHVLLTIEDYRKLTKKKESIIDLLAVPNAAEIDFKAPKIGLIIKSDHELLPIEIKWTANPNLKDARYL